MTPTSTIVYTIVLGALSAVGFTASSMLHPPQSPTDLPWKDIAGGGAAVLMLFALVVFLRFLSQDRGARDAERAKDREHVEKVVASFHATTEAMMTTMRDDHQSARRELHELVRDVRRPQP